MMMVMVMIGNNCGYTFDDDDSDVDDGNGNDDSLTAAIIICHYTSPYQTAFSIADFARCPG